MAVKCPGSNAIPRTVYAVPRDGPINYGVCVECGRLISIRPRRGRIQGHAKLFKATDPTLVAVDKSTGRPIRSEA